MFSFSHPKHLPSQQDLEDQDNYKNLYFAKTSSIPSISNMGHEIYLSSSNDDPSGNRQLDTT